MLAGFSNKPLLNGGLIAGSNSDFSDLQQKTMPFAASESLALSGLAGMGLPTSPVSISSTIGNSMVNQPLSRLEQQDMLLQQQVRSATPPVSATAQLSQLSHLTQSMHQERSLQASQQLAQHTAGGASQLSGGPGNQQPLLLGGGAQQISGLVSGSNLQQGKACGSSPQQVLGAVKVEPQSLGNSLQHQQILMPKMEVKTEMDLDQKVVQHPMHQSRPANNLDLTPEMQLQEALQRQQSKQMQAQFTALQQQRLLQGLPQQHLQDTTSLQLQQLQQQQHLQLQQQLQLHSAGVRKHPDFEAGVCARRLMQYLYHQRHRPPDNNIAFWRNFVGKYFAPNAKKRWCVSLYGNGGRQPTGIFPQDVWHCEICGTNPGRGFETTVEVLPRLFKIKFDSGIQEELLFVDLPHEYRQTSGHMVLEYGKAIQESVFEQLRVVREGQLRIVFSCELKILSWEFCARNHEELLPRRLIVPQVNQLAQISQKYQSSQSSQAGISAQDLQTNCHLFVTSARQLAKNLELPTVNDLGYTKRYVRCLQISEVVNSMKDLIDFSRDNSVGPIASLHKFPRRSDGSSRNMLRNAQIRALQEQQQRLLLQQEQQQQEQRQQQEQQRRQQAQAQQAQQAQQQQQQQDDLDLHSLLAETNTTALSGLQQQFNDASHLETQTVDGLDEAISAPTETDPLSSFFQSNSLAALQTSLHDTLQSPGNVPLASSGGGRLPAGSLQASPTNSLSFQNSFPSISGGNPYSRGDSSVVPNSNSNSVSISNNSNVVHHLLQEMMINQQLTTAGSNNSLHAAAAGRVTMLGCSNNHQHRYNNSTMDSVVGNNRATMFSSVGVGNGLSGLMNAHNARLNLAAAVAQQQQNQQQHDLVGSSSNMLGMTGGSFGGLFN